MPTRDMADELSKAILKRYTVHDEKQCHMCGGLHVVKVEDIKDVVGAVLRDWGIMGATKSGPVETGTEVKELRTVCDVAGALEDHRSLLSPPPSPPPPPPNRIVRTGTMKAPPPPPDPDHKPNLIRFAEPKGLVATFLSFCRSWVPGEPKRAEAASSPSKA